MPEEPPPAVPLPEEEPPVAGVPEDVDAEKSSVISHLIAEERLPDEFDTRELIKRFKKDQTCRKLLKDYQMAWEAESPLLNQIRLEVAKLDQLHRECIRLLNLRDEQMVQADSLWTRMRDKVTEMRNQLDLEQAALVRVKLGNRFIRKGEVPLISIASLRSRLEKQTGIAVERQKPSA